jgi:hypothetical protein
MSLQDVIEGVRARASNHGEFLLFPGDSIRIAVREKRVPNDPGVYLIFNCDDMNCPIYIGRAGTMNRDGTWRGQGVKKRLTAVQQKMPRPKFFLKMMNEQYHNGLTFRWYVTHDRTTGAIPAFIEMELLRAHYEQFHCLPEWNECI